MTAEPRPVRVTLEGQLCQVSKRRSVLSYSGGSLLIRHGAEDLTVEDLTPPRTWQRGDVIVNTEAGWTLTRGSNPMWVLSKDGSTRWTDADVAEALETAPYDRLLRVLRYQAGGDA